MDTKNYITIGTLAKVTGVHLKSLYYYEQIGILLPVFIDPKNGYRYYSHNQILVVGWIQHYVDLGLPLKEICNYISDDGHTIDSESLLAYEIEMTEKKIEMLKNKAQLLSKMKNEMEFSETMLSTDETVICHFEKKVLHAVPLKSPFSLISVQKELMKSFFALKELSLTPGNEKGLVCFERNGTKETYAFLEILNTQNIPNRPDILILPAGTYQCIKTSKPCFETAREYFPELFTQEYDRIIIETTLLTHTTNTDYTTFQLRCSMPTA